MADPSPTSSAEYVEPLVTTEDGHEDVYQRIQFRVHSFDNVISTWTAREPSPVHSIID